VPSRRFSPPLAYFRKAAEGDSVTAWGAGSCLSIVSRNLPRAATRPRARTAITREQFATACHAPHSGIPNG
jgi:hypothetical protein